MQTDFYFKTVTIAIQSLTTVKAPSLIRGTSHGYFELVLPVDCKRED